MKEKKILWIIIFNLIIIVFEIMFGLISNSFALIADALHNTGDVIAIMITYLAIKLATKKLSYKFTFGFLRAEMMAAFVNTIFLYITMIVMIYVAIQRFFTPEIIEPIYMISVGIVAVFANGISAYLLNKMGVASCSSHEHSHSLSHNHSSHSHNNEEDANIKSAYLHMLSDALISFGVIIAGIFIYFFKIYYIDSILTIIFSVYILFHSYSLLKKSFLSLMDANLSNIKKDDLNEKILIDDNILEYHDLHLHKPSSKLSFISFHLVLKDDSTILKQSEVLRKKIKHNLEDLGFNHILIQFDTSSSCENVKNCILELK